MRDAVREYAQLFKRARERLFDKIINAPGAGTKTYFNSVLRQLESELQLLQAATGGMVDTTIPAEYQKGLDETYAYFTRNNLMMRQPDIFAAVHRDAIHALAREMQVQIQTGLAQAGRQVLRYLNNSTDNALRQIGLEESALKLSSGTTVSDMRSNMIRQMQENGFFTVQYGEGANARQVPMDVYASMVARSTTREAGNLARENQLGENGHDLMQISAHYPTCEVCAKYQGRVFSISGKDARFPALSTAFSSGYRNIHPNCRHVAVPWIESLQTPDEIRQAIRSSNAPFADSRNTKEVALYNAQQAENRAFRQDLYQHERYRALIGEDVPPRLHQFRRVKKENGETWATLQEKYRLYRRAEREGTMPFAENSVVEEKKLVGYLLSDTHPRGRHKAFVVDSVLGYNSENWVEFSEKLKKEVLKSPIGKERVFTYEVNGVTIEAMQYEVPVVMRGIRGRLLRMTTCWQIDSGETAPRLNTIKFPEKRGAT